MKTTFAIIVAAIWLALGVAQAEMRTLKWDSGEAESMEYNEELAHFIMFFKQADWDKTFARELHVYGQRYGEVGEHLISVVLMANQSERFGTWEEKPDSLIIVSSVQVPMSSAPEEPGWFSIPLELVDLPEHFYIGIFSRSTEDFGVKIGKTATTNKPSYSCSSKPGNTDKDETAWFRSWEEGGNWMMRIEVSPTPTEVKAITSAELEGGFFKGFDDGEAEGFSVFQKGGPYIHVINKKQKRVKRVYVYAQVDGDWYNTERKASVFLLDKERRIIDREQLPYTRFSNQPSWNYVSFGGSKVPKDYYVLIEPFSRPGMGLEIGYDLSSENYGSDFGTVGVIYDWPLEIAKETTNWMIRVEYE